MSPPSQVQIFNDVPTSLRGPILQQMHDLKIAIIHGDIERRLAEVVLGVEVSAMVQQRLHRFGTVPVNGTDQCGAADAAARLGVRAMVQQHFDNFRGRKGGQEPFWGLPQLRLVLSNPNCLAALAVHISEPYGRLRSHPPP